jgi:hypothetical protein
VELLRLLNQRLVDRNTRQGALYND